MLQCCNIASNYVSDIASANCNFKVRYARTHRQTDARTSGLLELLSQLALNKKVLNSNKLAFSCFHLQPLTFHLILAPIYIFVT